MRHNTNAYRRAREAAAAAGLSHAPFYPEGLLPVLQGTFAALADLELRYEIAREALEALCESEDAKQRYRAELAEVHREVSQSLHRYLAHLQGAGKPVRSSH